MREISVFSSPRFLAVIPFPFIRPLSHTYCVPCCAPGTARDPLLRVPWRPVAAAGRASAGSPAWCAPLAGPRAFPGARALSRGPRPAAPAERRTHRRPRAWSSGPRAPRRRRLSGGCSRLRGRCSRRRAGRRTRPGDGQRAAACQVWRLPVLRPTRFRAGRRPDGATKRGLSGGLAALAFLAPRPPVTPIPFLRKASLGYDLEAFLM